MKIANSGKSSRGPQELMRSMWPLLRRMVVAVESLGRSLARIPDLELRAALRFTPRARYVLRGPIDCQSLADGGDDGLKVAACGRTPPFVAERLGAVHVRSHHGQEVVNPCSVVGRLGDVAWQFPKISLSVPRSSSRLFRVRGPSSMFRSNKIGIRAMKLVATDPRPGPERPDPSTIPPES